MPQSIFLNQNELETDVESSSRRTSMKFETGHQIQFESGRQIQFETGHQTEFETDVRRVAHPPHFQFLRPPPPLRARRTASESRRTAVRKPPHRRGPRRGGGCHKNCFESFNFRYLSGDTVINASRLGEHPISLPEPLQMHPGRSMGKVSVTKLSAVVLNGPKSIFG